MWHPRQNLWLTYDKPLAPVKFGTLSRCPSYKPPFLQPSFQPLALPAHIAARAPASAQQRLFQQHSMLHPGVLTTGGQTSITSPHE